MANDGTEAPGIAERLKNALNLGGEDPVHQETLAGNTGSTGTTSSVPGTGPTSGVSSGVPHTGVGHTDAEAQPTIFERAKGALGLGGPATETDTNAAPGVMGTSTGTGTSGLSNPGTTPMDTSSGVDQSTGSLSKGGVVGPVALGSEQSGNLREGGVNVTSPGTSATSLSQGSPLTDGSRGMTTTEEPAPSLLECAKNAVRLGGETTSDTSAGAGPGMTGTSTGAGISGLLSSGATPMDTSTSSGVDGSTGSLTKGGVVARVAPGSEQTGNLREGGINVTSPGTSATSLSQGSPLTDGSRGLSTTEESAQPSLLDRAKNAVGLGETTPEQRSDIGSGDRGITSGLGGPNSSTMGTGLANTGGYVDDGRTGHLTHAGTSNISEGGSTMATAGGSNNGSVTSGLGGAGNTMDSSAMSSTATSAVSSMNRGEMARTSASLAEGTSGLLSSDEHWAKAQAATEEARQQAKIVEAGARSHREAYEEYYKAERHEIKTKHTVEEIETRIRGFNLDSKRDEAKSAGEAYDLACQEQEHKLAEAMQANQEFEAMQTNVDAKGRELMAMVSASKMHADRLSHLEQELLELRANEEEARTRHTDHINGLGALRSKHDHHKSERSRMAEQLSELRAELDQLRGKEGQAQRTLDMHQNDFDSLEAEMAEADQIRTEKETALTSRKAELDRTMEEHGRLTMLLTQHRDAVGAMTKDTQEVMKMAEEKASLAERHASELEKTQQTLAGKQSSLEASQEALSAAAARERELRASQSGAAQDVETYAQRASALQADLATAKKRVDIAQAKKEELWELSKREGALADELSDVHYAEHVARPAGLDPTPMTSKSKLTADVAGRIKYGQNLAIDHQASIALSAAPSMLR